MAKVKWEKGICNYCKKKKKGLEMEECPACHRKGCMYCLKTGSDEPCDRCASKAASRTEARRRAAAARK